VVLSERLALKSEKSTAEISLLEGVKSPIFSLSTAVYSKPPGSGPPGGGGPPGQSGDAPPGGDGAPGEATAEDGTFETELSEDQRRLMQHIPWGGESFWVLMILGYGLYKLGKQRDPDSATVTDSGQGFYP